MGIFASTATDRMAALKEKAAHRQIGIDALKKSVDNAVRDLTAAKAEEARLKQALARTIDATDASADTMQDQLQKTLVMTAAQTEEHARLNIKTESNVEQFDALRARYEHLFKILTDKLKVLQRNALEDKETIKRLTLERDMYMGELTETIRMGLSKPHTKTAATSTQTENPRKGSSTSTSTGTPAKRAAETHHTPSPSGPQPPKETNALFNNFTDLGKWVAENRAYNAAVAKGEFPSLSPEQRHIYRCWVAARLIHKSSSPTSKSTLKMQKWMTGDHKESHIIQLSNNSCFQKGYKYLEISDWMKANNILFDAATAQIEAFSPSRTPAPSSSPQRPRVQHHGNTEHASPSRSQQLIQRKLEDDFPEPRTEPSPDPAPPEHAVKRATEPDEKQPSPGFRSRDPATRDMRTRPTAIPRWK